MPTCLADCPSEIVEAIVVLLELSDICNLRLADRQLASKATQDHFKSFFRKKRAHLTRTSLHELVNATRPGHLGCLVREITLVGVVYNTKRLRATLRNPARHNQGILAEAQRNFDIFARRRQDYEALHQWGEDVALLCEAFSNLATGAQDFERFSISLEVIVYRTDPEQPRLPSARGSWRLIWQSAAEIFQTALQALTTSRLPIGALNVFQNQDRCSIACNELGRNIQPDLGPASFSSLKSLTLSFSDLVFELTKYDVGKTGDSADELDLEELEAEVYSLSQFQAVADDNSNFAGLADLLRDCPALSDLELHHYRLRHPTGVYPPRYRFLQRIVETAALPRLQNLTFRGIIAQGEDMLALIKDRRLRTVSLTNFAIISGSFSSIFTHCTDERTGIERLHFDRLYENGRVRFDLPGNPDYWTSATLDRSGADVRSPIVYDASEPPDEPGNPDQHARRIEYQRVYGPP